MNMLFRISSPFFISLPVITTITTTTVYFFFFLNLSRTWRQTLSKIHSTGWYIRILSTQTFWNKLITEHRLSIEKVRIPDGFFFFFCCFGTHFLVSQWTTYVTWFLFMSVGTFFILWAGSHPSIFIFTYFVIFLSIFCFVFVLCSQETAIFFIVLNLRQSWCWPNFEIFHLFKTRVFRQNYHYFSGKNKPLC